MLILKLTTLIVLLAIFVQDIRSRSVHWVLFALLMVLLMTINLLPHQFLTIIWRSFLYNNIFLSFQLLMVTIYFSVKNRRFVNITTGLLGWGDILFLFSISIYLSVLNFLFFYVVSLIVVLLIWIAWQFISNKKNKHIPLAGLQALLFAFFLTGDWCLSWYHLTNDDWLLHLINKWI